MFSAYPIYPLTCFTIIRIGLVLDAFCFWQVAATGVSLYTFLQKNPKYDLSQWGSTLSSLGLIFMFYGLITLLQLIGVLPSNFLPYNEMVCFLFFIWIGSSEEIMK
jgi:hypothetical protein